MFSFIGNWSIHVSNSFPAECSSLPQQCVLLFGSPIPPAKQYVHNTENDESEGAEPYSNTENDNSGCAEPSSNTENDNSGGKESYSKTEKDKREGKESFSKAEKDKREGTAPYSSARGRECDNGRIHRQMRSVVRHSRK